MFRRWIEALPPGDWAVAAPDPESDPTSEVTPDPIVVDPEVVSPVESNACQNLDNDADVKLGFQQIQLAGLKRGTDFQFLPQPLSKTGWELVALGHKGEVNHYGLSAGGTQVLGNFQVDDVHWQAGCGLLSLAVGPSFVTEREIYLGFCTDEQSNRLSRMRLPVPGLGDEASQQQKFRDSEFPVLEISLDHMPDEIWHRWGSMGFEADGETLWVLMGDMFESEAAQDASRQLGSLLRLRPQLGLTQSYLPAVNNWSDPSHPLVFTKGLRSPWKGSLDSQGRYWIGDVGLVSREEINLVTENGQNLGWPTWEGRCEDDCDGLTQPLTSWGRKGGEPYEIDDPETEPETRRSAWVGELYEPGIGLYPDRYCGQFNDTVLFGDFFAGWVRQLGVDADGAVRLDRSVAHMPSVTGVRVGPDGYMYMLTLSGRFYRLVLE